MLLQFSVTAAMTATTVITAADSEPERYSLECRKTEEIYISDPLLPASYNFLEQKFGKVVIKVYLFRRLIPTLRLLCLSLTGTASLA